jgi:DNA-binding transcriptional regulator YdaS (Cro superfamily)
VLLLAAEGAQNNEIGDELEISHRTVEQHMTNMLQKTGASSRAELIARAYAGGVLCPGVWPPAWTGVRDLDSDYEEYSA